MPEEEENPCANFQKGKKFGDWCIIKKLDEGGFGQVYKVENIKTGKVAALKAEPNDVEGGSAIKLEMWVLRTLVEDGEKPHVPAVYHAAKHKKFCYMIMMLLGENLKHLKNNTSKEQLTPQTWARIAIQCLYGLGRAELWKPAPFRIKLVHDYGFVHRDIKPNNFVVGHRDDPERARIVHILDFGLTRSFANKKNGKWVARRARGTAEFRGTLRYCSPNVHEKKEQGRRDDLWGLLYVLIEFHCGLPWQKITDKAKVQLMKLNVDDGILLQNMPPEMLPLPAHLRTLDCYQRPDYSMFHNAFMAILKRYKVNHWDPFNWETKEQVEEIKTKVGGKLPAWENAVEFFKSDPLGINGPPPAKEKKSRGTDKASRGEKSKLSSMMVAEMTLFGMKGCLQEETLSKLTGGKA